MLQYHHIILQAVLSLEVIEDRSNEDALAFDDDAALARAEALATQDVVERYAHIGYVQLGTMGPKNPVQCQDYDTLTVTQSDNSLRIYRPRAFLI